MQKSVAMRAIFIIKKTAYSLKTPDVVFLPVIFLSFLFVTKVTRLSEGNGMSQGTFLTSWPWLLTYDLDLRTWPRYPSTWPPCQNSSPYVRLFSQESETDTHRDTQKHRHTDAQMHRRCQKSPFQAKCLLILRMTVLNPSMIYAPSSQRLLILPPKLRILHS